MFKETLPDLPYDYNALEPVISAEIMQLHHQKHHAGYVAGLNTALDGLAAAIDKADVGKIVSLQPAIRFNGGGHINHSLFWENLAPESKSGAPKAALKEAINGRWGSLEGFISSFNTTTAAVQGSGWGWLCYCTQSKKILITTCTNQDPLWGTTGFLPLLGIDVWEHAYYLQYKNARAEYLKNIWKVINWGVVSARYEKAIAS